MIGTPKLRLAPESDVLGNLLHSLCQPLTTLRCSLELSLDEFTERQCESVSVALEQADRAIETVRLMREYLELERGPKPLGCVALAPALCTVLRQLSVVADARGIPLLASGASTAVLAINEFWLHRALRYLIGSLLEERLRGNAIAIFLEDRPFSSLLSIHSVPCRQSANRQSGSGGTGGHLQQAKLAIAWRVLESAGAPVESCLGDDKPGFVVRVPQARALPRKLSA